MSNVFRRYNVVFDIKEESFKETITKRMYYLFLNTIYKSKESFPPISIISTLWFRFIVHG